MNKPEKLNRIKQPAEAEGSAPEEEEGEQGGEREAEEEKEDEKEDFHYATLPLISTLAETADFQNSRKYLLELESLKETAEATAKRFKFIMTELEKIQRKAEMPGLRFGGLCYVYKVSKGKRTLNKGLLLAQKVTAAQIEAAMKMGKPIESRTFKVIEV